MDEILKFLPTLPIWLSAPIIIGAALIVLSPRVVELMRNLSAWHRAYDREKKRLELLKLHYEIEAIKKNNDLTKAPTPSFLAGPQTETPTPDTEEEQPLREEQAAPAPAHPVPLNGLQRFAYGAAGAVTTAVLELPQGRLELIVAQHSIAGLLGYGLATLLMVAVAGLTTYLLLQKEATPFTCFLTGMAVPLLMKVMLTSSPEIQGSAAIKTIPEIG